MTAIIHDTIVEERLRAERIASGGDRYDEVWENVYMMAPMPNHEHQLLVGRFTQVLDEVVTDAELGEVVPGVNVSDRVAGWETNYRVPDGAVFLNTTRAVNHDQFWCGGPDLVIEIVSPHDQTREKLRRKERGLVQLIRKLQRMGKREARCCPFQGCSTASSASAECPMYEFIGLTPVFFC